MRNFLILFLSVLSMTITAQTTISIIGTATQHNDWNTDVTMTETFASSGIWTATIPLYAGTTFGSPNAVKFRQSNTWAVNWGDNDNAYPMGTGAQDEANIEVPITGYYVVTINTSTGAYSFAPATDILYVDVDASSSLGYNDGHNWAHAFVSLQSALALAHQFTSIDEVWVAEGTYKPSAYPHGCSGCASARDYTFHLRDGLKIYGGFAGTETSIGARNIAAHPTTLSGDFDDNDVVIGSGATLSIAGNGENAHHVVLAVAPSSGGIGVTVDGFSVTGGNAYGSSSIQINGIGIFRNDGGGINISYGSNTLSNNNINGNHAGAGGGIFTSEGTNTLSNNTIYENYTSFGGGIRTSFGTNTLTNNSIFGNHSYRGGGIYTWLGTNTLTNNTIYGNYAEFGGGGIWTHSGTNSLKNNIFWSNQKTGSNTDTGADYENDPTAPPLSTNTFTNNMLQLANNTTNYPTTGGTTYTNNIYATDPLFVNPADPDGPDNLHPTTDDGLSVTLCSPAINAGTPTGAPTEDITGATRLSNPDIGAYENNPSVVSIVYVKHNATGLNDGTSWANAFTSLQSALQAAHTCPGIDEVWVAEGTYKPSAYPHGCTGCATNRDFTFHLRDGLKIYGGFAGTETSLSARNIAAHPTILSGDFEDNDEVTGSGATLSIAGNGGNAYHVVLALAPEIGGIGVTIDGFNTTGGNSDGAATITVNSQIVFRGSGGAIYTDFGTNTLTNNTIYGNNADHGGGISTSNGTNTLTNNTIYENNADHGGGISTSNGTYTLTNNTIYGNNAVNNGGGISTSDGTNALTNNTIYGNNAVNNGGGIFTWNSTWTGTNTLTTNNIYENSATNGGGIFIYIGYNTVVSKNVINYNTAEFGGGIFVYAGGSNTIENNSLHNNIANEYGGLYIYYSYTNTIVNNTFYNNNSIEEAGGALYTTSGSNQIYNNIFWNNQFNGNATIAGADYEYGGEASANDFRNNMLQLPNNTTNYPTTGGTTYTNNIYATDPLFVNPTDPDGPDNLHRTADDGLSIQPCSPAINAGTPTGAPTEDITGATRLSNPDIGAYENNPSVVSIVYVKHNATGLNDGTSWTNAFTSLQSALQAAHTCPGIDEVWVAEGTYKPSAYPHGCTGCASARDYTFHLRDGLKIYGGFVGTETSLSARTIAAHPTILSGDFIGDDIVTGSGATLSITGNSENARHVVLAVAPEIGGIGVTIDGFRVTGGNGGGGIISVSGVEIFGSSGGGLATYFGDNNIFNSVITGNNAPATGGGMYNHIGIYNISNNIIYKNMSHHGGGLTNYHCTSNLNNNTIYENNSSATGGGIDINYSTNTLTNNVFFENFSLYGGGIDVAFSNATMINNSIFKNVAAHQGGGISSWQSNCSFSNNTIYKNNSNEKGSGIYTTYGNNTIQNNIFWANQKGGNTTVAGADYENHSSNPSTNIFENNMLQLPNNTTNYPTTGGTTYSNNIYAQDPLFVNPSDPDGTDNIHRTADDGLAVLSHSPAVDNGTTTGAPVEDITGSARSTIPDIGAYEVSCSPTPRSVYLSGSNYVSVPGYTEINTFAGDKLTLEAWVSATTLQPIYWQGSVVSKSSQDPDPPYTSNGFDLRMGANGIDFNLGTNSGFQSALYTFTPQTHRWYHIAGVFDGDSLLLYLDGQRVAGLAYTGTFNNNTEPLFIGDNGTWTGRHFHGRIDEVKVWNRALKPGELSYFSRHTHCNPYGLVAYFQFNEDDDNDEPINSAPDASAPKDGTYLGDRSCAGVEMLASPSQIYVNASALKSGDGSSWSQALKTLDEGIVASHYCTAIDKMHIAEGSYIPTYKPFEMWVGNKGREISTPSKRDATFHVRAGLEVLGGYDATIGVRNPKLFATNISGDINDTGDPAFDLYHVGMMVYKNSWDINDTTIVDGINFKDGKAEVKTSSLTINGQPIQRDNGGGIYIHGGRNRISNSLIKINKADTKGGGMHATGFEHVSIKANHFDQNVADEGDGGGACIIATGAGSVLAEGNLFQYVL